MNIQITDPLDNNQAYIQSVKITHRWKVINEHNSWINYLDAFWLPENKRRLKSESISYVWFTIPNSSNILTLYFSFPRPPYGTKPKIDLSLPNYSSQHFKLDYLKYDHKPIVRGIKFEEWVQGPFFMYTSDRLEVMKLWADNNFGA